jgi:hypothetical protein
MFHMYVQVRSCGVLSLLYSVLLGCSYILLRLCDVLISFLPVR